MNEEEAFKMLKDSTEIWAAVAEIRNMLEDMTSEETAILIIHQTMTIRDRIESLRKITDKKDHKYLDQMDINVEAIERIATKYACQ